MISLIEARNFRCLRHVRQPLGPFHVLVGPNASGKTTFLDVIAFLGRLVSDGLEAAVEERTSNFQDLTWNRQGERFELAIEAMLPEELVRDFAGDRLDRVRYVVGIGHLEGGHVGILDEQVFLKSATDRTDAVTALPATLIVGQPPVATWVVERGRTGAAEYQAEGVGQHHRVPFKFSPQKSALGGLPYDKSLFPAAMWLKDFLTKDVRLFELDYQVLRKPSLPARGKSIRPDGSNLPWVIDDLQNSDPRRFGNWIRHIQAVLPDVETIRTVERPEEKSRYLMIRYQGGLEVPSWMVSEGTLRLLALTIPAYLIGFTGVYLVEEPENGIHPRAVEAVYQSLSSVYHGQVLLATHSPLLVGLVDPDKILCFNKNDEGATEIILGSEHPALRDWKHEVDLGTLFAGGFLE